MQVSIWQLRCSSLFIAFSHNDHAFEMAFFAYVAQSVNGHRGEMGSSEFHLISLCFSLQHLDLIGSPHGIIGFRVSNFQECNLVR